MKTILTRYFLLFLFVLVLCFVASSNGQVPVAIAPDIYPVYFGSLGPNAGEPLVGGFLYAYQAGTTTLQDTYVDSSGTIKNSNPIPLDSAAAPSNGSTETGIWLANQSYKFCAYNAALVQQWCRDNITGYLNLLNLVNTWTFQNTWTLPLIDTATDNQLVFGAVGNQTTVDFPPPTGNITIHFPSTAGTVLTSASPTINTPTVTGGPFSGGVFTTPTITWLKSTTVVTQTGDTALHTIYTIAVPAGMMGANNQMRVTLLLGVNANAGAAVIAINYGGSRISAPVALAAALAGNNGIYETIVGGNLGITNSQTWDTLATPTTAAGATGNTYHQTTAVDSTLSQNVTVTFTGGANADSVTFYRCIVEIL
jgi:hypothetical protein